MNSKKIIIAVIIIVIVFCITILSITCYLFPIKYKNEILEFSKENNISPILVASVINAESRFRAEAQSAKGAMGLMQILPSTAQEVANELGITDFTPNALLTPAVNIKIGTKYLAQLINEFKNTDTALCAYNAGPNKVRQWLNNSEYSSDKISLNTIPYPETQKYIQRIKFYQKIYAGFF